MIKLLELSRRLKKSGRLICTGLLLFSLGIATTAEAAGDSEKPPIEKVSIEKSSPERIFDEVEEVVGKSGVCDRFLLQPIKRGAIHVYHAVNRFNEERRQDRLGRFLYAPRRDPRAFSWRASIINPAFDFPIELVSRLRWKYTKQPPFHRRMSLFTALPSGATFYFLLFYGGGIAINDWSTRVLEHSVREDVFGAAYAAEWVLSGELSARRANSILPTSAEAFAHGLEPLRARVKQFEKLILWTPDQIAAATAILNRLEANARSTDLYHATTLKKFLYADPGYQSLLQSLPPQYQFTMGLFTEPIIETYGKSDAYWLSVFFEPFRQGGFSADQLKALDSLTKIYGLDKARLSLATLSAMVAQSLNDVRAIENKKAYAQRLGLPMTASYLYRADFPFFATGEKFRDLNSVQYLSGEVDRWKIITSDPRFASIRESFNRGEISELGALIQADSTMHALGQVYGIHSHSGQPKLTNEEACTLVNGNEATKTIANPIFNDIRTIGDRVTLPAGAGEKVWALQYALAQISYAAIIDFGNVGTVDVEKRMEQERNEEKNLIREVTTGKVSLTEVKKCGP